MRTSAVYLIIIILLFMVATGVFYASGYVISAVLANPMINVVSAKPELPPTFATPNTKIDTTSLTPTPEPEPTPASPPTFVRVANTGGDGVFLRRTPRSGDRLVAWNEGTVMEIIGEDREAEGVIWKHVKDPKGNSGWIPAQYAIEASP
jgi:hypothetical protein